MRRQRRGGRGGPGDVQLDWRALHESNGQDFGESRRPRNETARLRGGPHVRQSRGYQFLAVLIFPDMLLSVKLEVVISGDGGALPPCVTHPCDGPHRPKGNVCPFATRWPLR